MKRVLCNLHVLSPPEGKEYAELLQRVIATMDAKEAIKIAQRTLFVFIPDYTEGLMIPLTPEKNIVVLFKVPARNLELQVICHELGHLACGHPEQAIASGGSFPAKEDPLFENEAHIKADEILKGFVEVVGKATKK